MKLWYSFKKELILSSRSFYFYIEIFMALVILLLLLFVIPEHFENRGAEYIHLDLPKEAKEAYIKEIEEIDDDGRAEDVEIKSGGEVISAKLYLNKNDNMKKVYIIDDKEAMISLAEAEKNPGAVVELDPEGKLHYKYYLQGYESQRLKNLVLILHVEESDIIKSTFDNQKVIPLSADYDELTDRENAIPSLLTFNGSLMGLFIIAAYIFLDKKEGVIKAYALTASSVWQYLMSKVGVVLVTATISSFLIVLPVMGLRPNYPLLLLFLITSGFFIASLGLLVASFYKDIMQAFGAIYILLMAMILPNISYFMPSWQPSWIRILPTYPILQGFKEIIRQNGDVPYVLMASLGFLGAGIVLFFISNRRYKKTLTV